MTALLRKNIWRILRYSGITRLLSDRQFTVLMYWASMGKRVDLVHPQDFNQKEQWLKLYHRDPLWVMCADKYAVREYVRKEIGGQYLNECIGVYERVGDIDYEKLPRRFVLKATHGSGWNLICTDKAKFDWRAACKVMRTWLRSDFSRVGREWQYHEIKPRIVCEAFMEEEDGSPLRDYKLFTFAGETKYVAVEFDKPDGRHCLNVYDADGVFQPDKMIGHPNDSSYAKSLPSCWGEMKGLAKRIAGAFPMCRVDFYVLGGKKVVFGELTFTPGKGCNDIRPQSFCDELGSYIQLSKREGGR